MDIKRVAGIVCVISGLAGSLVLSGCGDGAGGGAETIEEIRKESGYPVRVYHAEPSRFRVIEESGGTVMGTAQSVITSVLQGEISSIRVNEGDRVGRNQVLLTVSPEYIANMTGAEERYELLKKQYERMKTLHEEGGVSQSDLDAVKMEYEAVKSQLTDTKTQRIIRSPFSGRVLQIYERPASKVNPGDKLIKVGKVSEVRIDMRINETRIERFSSGQECFVALKGDTVTGSIERVAAGGNSMTHAFRVTSLFDNSEGLLRPGMYSTVGVVVEDMDSVITVPKICIKKSEGSEFVYVTENGRAHKRVVETGRRSSGMVEISDGLRSGDKVIRKGISKVSAGVKIKIVD
ncbi:MAG: efflux RND transporter periplasmic adaptor subunit [Chitinivibrionales bacterium]